MRERGKEKIERGGREKQGEREGEGERGGVRKAMNFFSLSNREIRVPAFPLGEVVVIEATPFCTCLCDDNVSHVTFQQDHVITYDVICFSHDRKWIVQDAVLTVSTRVGNAPAMKDSKIVFLLLPSLSLSSSLSLSLSLVCVKFGNEYKNEEWFYSNDPNA